MIGKKEDRSRSELGEAGDDVPIDLHLNVCSHIEVVDCSLLTFEGSGWVLYLLSAIQTDRS